MQKAQTSAVVIEKPGGVRNEMMLHTLLGCLFPDGDDVEETRCAVMSVFAPLTGIVGSMQAAEALKVITGCGEALVGKLLLINALDMGISTVRYGKDAKCAVCR